jgi:dipeptidase D
MSIAHLAPQPLWKHFQALCDRPRPSKHEQLVIDYLREFAEDHHLTFLQDEVGNVVIKKAASPGMEKARTIAMQCHIDMVPQKRNDISHDFYKDPIRPVVDGNIVRAQGTTLGADNGIGVAAMLAIMESSDIAHGPLEALFTIDEEAGMSGAKGLNGQILEAEILFNLDSEDEGELYVGCAGGVDVTVNCPITTLPSYGEVVGMMLHFSGLRGGHSGIDIHLGRANANLLMAELLLALRARFDVSVMDFQGGTLRNAIPRDAKAIIAAPTRHADAIQAYCEAFLKDKRDAFVATEPSMALVVASCQVGQRYYDGAQIDTLLRAILATPNGVLERHAQHADIIQTSSNLAIVKSVDGAIQVQCLVRSAENTAKYRAGRDIAACYDELSPSVDVDGAYSGWRPNMDSPVLAKMAALYARDFGSQPEVKVIHAGLECGILGGIYPHLDMISFGPTIRCAHSPDEYVEIASVARFWDYLCTSLTEVAKSA